MRWLREIDGWLIDSVLPHGREFRAAAARVVGRDEAEDVVQEAYGRLLGYANWREIIDPRAFCLRVIRNLALERLRKADVVNIDRIASLDALDVADEAPNSFRHASARLEVDRLIALIDALPPQCGRVVRLRKLEGQTPSEIAVHLGLSVSTVETHLAKGLARLTEGMREIETKGTTWPKIRARRTKT